MTAPLDFFVANETPATRSGNLGGAVAERTRDLEPRLVMRDPSKAPPGFEVAQARYEDGDAVARALDGVDVVLMVSIGDAPDPVGSHQTFIDAAVRSGVRHLVYTSVFAASPEAIFAISRAHAATEEIIRASGLDFTILRDNFYLELVASFVGDDGIISGPAGGGRVAAVARLDVADVAAVMRRPDSHVGATYSLTGSEALTLAEVADRIGAATGRDVRYGEETVEEAYASRRAMAPDEKALNAWVSTYTAIAAGEFDGATQDVLTVAGHPPRSLEDVLGAS